MVVVGAGLLGVSAAYHLAVAGMAPLLLESGAPGAGATGRSAGMLVPGLAVPYPHAVAVLGHDTARELYHRSVRNVALVRRLVEREQIDCALSVDGMLTLGLGDRQCAAGRMLADVLTADGFAARIVEREDLGELVGTPVAEHVGGGLLLPDAASVDPARLVTGLADAARGHGADLMGGVTVRSIAAEGERVRLETSAGPVSAAAAVLALNAWTPELLPELGRFITPARAQMLAYEPTERVFGVPVTASVGEHGEYWRQTADGEIVVGGRRDLDTGSATQVPTDEVQRALEQILPELFPRLALPPVGARWAGTMALTPDGLPLAGPVPGVPGAWFSAGCNGHGLAFAAHLGRELADAVVVGRTPAELAPFSPSRPSLG